MVVNAPSPTFDVVERNNVTMRGEGRPIVFAHGFGCSQDMWRLVLPHFTDDNRVVLFDHVGAGNSDLSAYRPGKYDSLDGYAADLLEILEVLDLRDAVIVGHSVSAMVAVLAANRDPARIGALVLLGPSPRYIDTADYRGGFSQADIDDLLDGLDANYFGWSKAIAPVMMGNLERPELSEELDASFCRTDPAIARHFARVTFLSDNRRDLDAVTVPTLVLQSENDAIAPVAVGRYVAERIAGSELVVLPVNGHCAHLSAPDLVAAAIRRFLK